MYTAAKLLIEEMRTLFRNTAQKMGINEAIIEKDFWVCLTVPSYRLDALRANYESMSEMMFGNFPNFDTLMNYITVLQEEINQL